MSVKHSACLFYYRGGNIHHDFKKFNKLQTLSKINFPAEFISIRRHSSDINARGNLLFHLRSLVKGFMLYMLIFAAYSNDKFHKIN
jgi:hypothetical protein